MRHPVKRYKHLWTLRRIQIDRIEKHVIALSLFSYVVAFDVTEVCTHGFEWVQLSETSLTEFAELRGK